MPSNLLKIPNADNLERAGSGKKGTRLWKIPPRGANTLHKPIRAEEFYFVPDGTGRIRIAAEPVTVPKHGGIHVDPNQFLQVFNDPDKEPPWLIIRAPE